MDEVPGARAADTFLCCLRHPGLLQTAFLGGYLPPQVPGRHSAAARHCSGHEAPRCRALELVAEMRGRGIPCNVHTYSALMNVCIKANELDLALDVYKQLLAEGCAPNLVTYNTLIDVYGKTTQWEEAVKVLDALEQQVGYFAVCSGHSCTAVW